MDNRQNSTNINWYPGHMYKTKKEIIEDLKLVDIVVELLDARIPVSSQNPDFQELINKKKKIVVLNKSDLADSEETKKWVRYFASKDITAIIADSNSGKGIRECLNAINKAVEEEVQKAADKGRINKNIRIMILGIPNVGKSSFINRAINKKSANVGNKPGVTKQKQWVRISSNIELLDTPGVLWPKFEDEKIALNLAYIGTIKDEVLDKEEVAYFLLKYLYKNYKNNIMERYKLTNDELNSIIPNELEDETIILMNLIAKKRGAIISGGEIDFERISGIILSDFRSGKIGNITLEKVNER